MGAGRFRMGSRSAHALLPPVSHVHPTWQAAPAVSHVLVPVPRGGCFHHLSTWPFTLQKTVPRCIQWPVHDQSACVAMTANEGEPSIRTNDGYTVVSHRQFGSCFAAVADVARHGQEPPGRQSAVGNGPVREGHFMRLARLESCVCRLGTQLHGHSQKTCCGNHDPRHPTIAQLDTVHEAACRQDSAALPLENHTHAERTTWSRGKETKQSHTSLAASAATGTHVALPLSTESLRLSVQYALQPMMSRIRQRKNKQKITQPY